MTNLYHENDHSFSLPVETGTAENPIDLNTSPLPIIQLTQELDPRELTIQTENLVQRAILFSDDEDDSEYETDTEELTPSELSECEDDTSELNENLYGYIMRRLENLCELSPNIEYYLDVEYNTDEMPIFNILMRNSSSTLMIAHELHTYTFTTVGDRELCMFAYFDYLYFNLIHAFIQ